VFGTDARGRAGKACKNVVRLAMLPADGELRAADLAKAMGVRLRVPVTSVRNWAAYAGMLTRGLHRPLFTVVSDVVIEPDPHNTFTIRFEPVAAIEDESVLDALEGRLDEVKATLEEPPPLDLFAPAPTPRKRKPARQARRQVELHGKLDELRTRTRKARGRGRA